MISVIFKTTYLTDEGQICTKLQIMKKLYLSILLGASIALSAQVADKTVTDCNSTTKSIYAALATGKPLVVASKGFDCSNCRSTAAALQNWAAQNTNVQVWGAMTFNYSSNTPMCSDVSAWVNQYNWTNIFSFIDDSRHWYKFGTPRYYVYDPADSTIAYEGSSQSTALSTAAGLVTTVGQAEVVKKEFTVNASNATLSLFNLPQGQTTVQVVSLTGNVVKTVNFNSPAAIETVSLDKFSAGIYLVNVQNKNGFSTVRKVYLR